MPILEKGPENGRNIFSTSNITLPLVQAQDIPQTFQIFWYSSNIKTFLLNGSQCPPTSAFDSGFNVNLCQLSALSAAQSAAQLSHCFPRATTGGLVLGTVLPKSFTSDVEMCSDVPRDVPRDVPMAMCQECVKLQAPTIHPSFAWLHLLARITSLTPRWMAFSLHVEQCRTATLSKQGNIIFYWTNNQISTATSQVLTAFSVCVCVHHRESSQKHVLSVYSLQLPNSQCKTQLLDKMKTCVKQMSVHVSSSHIYPHFKPLRPGIFMSSKFRPRLSCQRLAQFPLQTQKQVTASGSHKPKISKIKWS